MDLADRGIGRALVVADPGLISRHPVQAVLESLRTAGIPFTVYDRVSIEPTDRSFLDAIAFGRQQVFDAIVAVGGGSTIDTAKAINLHGTLLQQRLTRLAPRPAHADDVARMFEQAMVAWQRE